MRAFAGKRNEALERDCGGRGARPGAYAPARARPANPLEHLQRTFGNSAVRRMVQPKLAVSTPGDAYEEEADRVAEQVMRAPAPQLQRECACGGGCAGCREEETPKTGGPQARVSRLVQTKGDGGLEADDEVTSSIERSRGGGSPLDASTREDMEGRFGADFRSVRVHTDGEAARMSRDLNAHAFTVGSDIYFNGNYEPDSQDGRRLLAHELTHVLQQEGDGGGRVQRWAVTGCTTPQREYIDDAVTRAWGDLSAVLPLVSARPVTEAVKDALWLAFRNDADATADLARDNVRRLKDQITGTRFTCTEEASDRECAGGTLANAPVGNAGGSVHICRPQFFGDDMSIYAQSETVIHEAAHMYLSMQDHGYFAAPRNLCSETPRPSGTNDPGARYSGTAGDNPSYRLENADSYGCFVHYLRYVPSDGRHRTAQGYRGANLDLEADDLSFSVYTRTNTPETHRFSVTGVPDNGGFRFRWKIIANNREYNPTSSASGVNAGAFDERNTSIYVPSSLTQLLWNDGVRSARLVCEIEIFGAGDGRYAPQVIIKEKELSVVNGEPPFNL